MKKKLVSIMLVAAMALSVAACGSSKGNSAKTDGTEAMASSVSKTPDNQISINLASEPQTIDPALSSAVDGWMYDREFFRGSLYLRQGRQADSAAGI